MILDVYTDPTDQDDADDTRTDLIIQMLVDDADDCHENRCFKNFDISKQELFAGVGKPECREH